MKYKIEWSKIIYGQSFFSASDENEAEMKTETKDIEEFDNASSDQGIDDIILDEESKQWILINNIIKGN